MSKCWYSFLIRPSSDTNYNFVSGAYGVGSLIALTLYILERILSDFYLKPSSGTTHPTKENTPHISESWKEFTESLQGLYLIFIPFIPCFVWSLIVRKKWLQETSIQSLSIEQKKNE